MRTAIVLLVLAMLVSPVCADPASEPMTDTTAAWSAMIDPAKPSADRAAAERTLLNAADSSLLRMVFESLDDVVRTHTRVVDPQAMHYRETGSPEGDARSLPVGAQIVFAKFRVWDHLSRNAAPDEQRLRVLASLFPLAESDFQKRKLLEAFSETNWAPEIERGVGDWFLERTMSCDTRAYAAAVLNRRSIETWRESILKEAWALRGQDCARRLVGYAFRTSDPPESLYDPRLAVIVADDFVNATREEDARSGAFAALGLGDVLRVTFIPKPDAGLEWASNEWYQAIVANASVWLDAHQAELEADAELASRGQKVGPRHAEPDFVPYQEAWQQRPRGNKKRD